MARRSSKVKKPHRKLRVDRGDLMSGADVLALQHACKSRLDARNIYRRFTDDAQYGPETDAALRTAIWYLGCTQATHDAKGLSVGAQRMVRFPGQRGPKQLERARQRMDALRADRKKAAARSSSSGGSLANLANKRSRARDAAMFALHHAPRHYTQGASRWDPIRSGATPGGHMWSSADCSSVATWVIWHALGHGGPDVVNGAGWAAGYTGTMLAHGIRISRLEHHGDCVIYGNGYPGQHVAVYVGDGMVVSHGSEGGPYLVPYNYRGDIMEFRRYLL